MEANHVTTPEEIDTNWHKSCNSVFNLNQTSPAMSMQEGFNQTRSTISMHITKKRELRDKISPSFYRTKSKDDFVKKVSEILVQTTPSFSWNTIINNMKDK